MLDASDRLAPPSPDESSGSASICTGSRSRAVAAGVEHLVSCTQSAHDSTKETVRSWLEYKTHWPERLPAWLAALTDGDRRDLSVYLATSQPWPGTSLRWWNCPCCHSTLAVCVDCRDEGVIETGYGPGAHEEQCSCQEVVA
jgi:hypothetical protein